MGIRPRDFAVRSATVPIVRERVAMLGPIRIRAGGLGQVLVHGDVSMIPGRARPERIRRDPL